MESYVSTWNKHVHENKAYLINNYLFLDNAVAASLWKIRK